MSTPDRRQRAGVVGLGMIGGGVAISLARSGRVPAVFDVRPEAADALDGVPAALGSPADVARESDVVMVAVVDAEQARAVVTGPDGLLAAAHPGLTVVLLSTIALPVVHELSAACSEAGAAFLDCGVTPGDKAAQHGMLAIVGGEGEAVERAAPVLRDWAKDVVHCGPQGAGMATKVARNVITYGSWRAVSEAAALVNAAGVDSRTLATVVGAADPDGATLFELLKVRHGELPPGLPPMPLHEDRPQALLHRIDGLMAKDLDAARELAAQLGVPTPLVDTAREHVRDTLGLETPEDGDSRRETGRRERGLRMMDEVYGPGISAQVSGRGTDAPDDPFTDETVDHLFADVWSRPDLSVRDRRLLTLGATAALGRSDLVRIQSEGALESGDLSSVQLREAVLHLAYYVGWGNATATHQGITEAVAAHSGGSAEKPATGNTGTDSSEEK